jgi:hypothetical protein
MHNPCMQPLAPSTEAIRLNLTKQLFRDGWIFSHEKQEYGELRFGSLRLKASGKSAEGEYELKKDKQSYTVVREGRVIAEYTGKTAGKLKLADGTEYELKTEMVSTLPGSINVQVINPEGSPIVRTETTWNGIGVPHCQLVVEPNAPTGDNLWGAIFSLLRVVVDHSLWNVSRDAAAKAFVTTTALRTL